MSGELARQSDPALAAWIAAAPRRGRATVRTVMRGLRRYQRKAVAEVALDALYADGVGVWIDRPRHLVGRPTRYLVLAGSAAAGREATDG